MQCLFVFFFGGGGGGYPINLLLSFCRSILQKDGPGKQVHPFALSAGYNQPLHHASKSIGLVLCPVQKIKPWLTKTFYLHRAKKSIKSLLQHVFNQIFDAMIKLAWEQAHLVGYLCEYLGGEKNSHRLACSLTSTAKILMRITH